MFGGFNTTADPGSPSGRSARRRSSSGAGSPLKGAQKSVTSGSVGGAGGPGSGAGSSSGAGAGAGAGGALTSGVAAAQGGSGSDGVGGLLDDSQMQAQNSNTGGNAGGGGSNNDGMLYSAASSLPDVSPGAGKAKGKSTEGKGSLNPLIVLGISRN
jgi:hypothetical protein